MKATDLIKNPDLIFSVPEYDLELTAREVVEVFAAKSRKRDAKRGLRQDWGKRCTGKKKTDKIAERLLRFVAAIHKLNPEFSNAIICAYAKLDGNVNVLIMTASRLKNDPEVGPYLDYLRTRLNPGGTYSEERYRQGRMVVRRAEERACMWTGANAEETRRQVQNILR
jgi:hypothetical protein